MSFKLYVFLGDEVTAFFCRCLSGVPSGNFKKGNMTTNSMNLGEVPTSETKPGDLLVVKQRLYKLYTSGENTSFVTIEWRLPRSNSGGVIWQKRWLETTAIGPFL